MKSIKPSRLSIILILVLAVTYIFAGCGTQTNAPAPSTAVADAANGYFANLPDDINKIAEKDFVAKVKANEDMSILDIRQADVYAKGHIKGAVNAPWGTAISDNLGKLPKDKAIMVYCYTGQTAGQTVALLNMAGFKAKSVNLGWDLGISKVEGVADVTETTENAFKDVTSLEINADVKAAIKAYFKGLADVKGTTYTNYKISENDAKKLLDSKDKSVVFLSIRKAEDYAKGHIEGAINIPFAKGMEKSFNKLPKDKKIIVYCYTGQTAGQTVAVLKMLGYDAVSLNAGMGNAATGTAGWVNKGYPVVQ